MSGKAARKPLSDDAHTDAAAAFGERARSKHGTDVIELYVFGSTVRGEAHGRSSDVDVLVVIDENDRDPLKESLRDIALDVMLEYGPAIELHILSETTFERHQREQNPFIQNVLSEGQSYG
ncbi:nucleotidyltransferase domain-containing protein [Halococcus sp. IIIV-5B]|uniref:nucleotidyltransferase domain-containing protein n=1 Tax=Halococcus sp. IIIV-5B TaxID=2321230 RepID=UPI000E7295EE|nr:nucleotidyltransferase domain-containing protein [Halococcus sp. IIIV-5B]RJT07059.1 nucleotidyltransferase domain-containing protein [Halococcus sp. IIIV-5B]